MNQNLKKKLINFLKKNDYIIFETFNFHLPDNYQLINCNNKLFGDDLVYRSEDVISFIQNFEITEFVKHTVGFYTKIRNNNGTYYVVLQSITERLRNIEISIKDSYDSIKQHIKDREYLKTLINFN